MVHIFQQLPQTVLAAAEALDIAAEHSETFFQIPLHPAGQRFNFLITPGAPYFATIIHRFSFGNIVPGAFQLWAGQRGMTYHTAVITADFIRDGVATWIVVTGAAPLIYSLQNISPLNQYFESYYYQINIYTSEELEMIRRIVRRITIGSEELIARPMVPMPIAPR